MPSQNAPQALSSLLRAKVTVPQNVVFRRFPAETVVLNLQTGKYHGLNPTAGRMLEALAESDTVGQAVEVLAEEYERPVPGVEKDIQNLCQALLDRGLIETEVQTGD
jgi:Coenzyme PQQ synthesis protein D (PqqD)